MNLSESEKIRRESERRGISRICHITQSRKLPHIFGSLNGLYSAEWLRSNRPDLLDSNDEQRLDGKPDHISCSIEYPNGWYWDSIRQKVHAFKDWVVLLIRPDVLWRSDTYFCPRNCAASNGYFVRSGYMSFLELFGPEIIGAKGIPFRRTPNILSCCPTDGQAEIMVHRHIELEMIFGIGVINTEQADDERHRLRMVGVEEDKIAQVTWIVEPFLFGPRWSPLVRSGKRPPQQILE